MEKAFGAAYLGFIALVIVLADRGSCGAICAPAKAFAYGDKVGHLVLVGLLAAACYAVFTRATVTLLGVSVSIASAAVFVFISCEELSQLWFPYRTADWGDLVCSYLGIVLFEYIRRSARGSGALCPGHSQGQG